MGMSRLPLIAIGLGLSLLVGSLLWPGLVGSTVWDEKQALERSQAAAEFHQLVHQQAHAGAHGAKEDKDHAHEQSSGDLSAAKARYQQADAQLQHARFLRGGAAAILKWAGVLLLAIGAGAYVIQKRAGQ